MTSAPATTSPGRPLAVATAAPHRDTVDVDIVLIPGLWLDGSCFDDVVVELQALGHRATALTLPGQGDGSTTATLDDQLATVLVAVDGVPGRPLLVGHAFAGSLAWMAADRRPRKVAGVIFLGDYPWSDGVSYAGYFEQTGSVMPFPGWDVWDSAQTADLDAGTRHRIEAATHPMPARVARGVVQLYDEQRFDVPVTLVCLEMTPAMARSDIEGEEAPELERARYLQLVDLDSGSWPMYSAPAQLGRIIADVAKDRG